MLALLLALGAGCSGVNVGGTVSPATFFLPGVKADPPAAPPVPLSTVPVPTRLAVAD